MDQRARALGRISGRILRANRYVHAGIEAGKATARHSRRAVRALWFEVTGFIFCALGAVAGLAGWREWQSGSAGWRIATTVAVALMFLYFGGTAFWKARARE